MSRETLPETLDLGRVGERGVEIAAAAPIARMERLRQVAEIAAPVDVRLVVAGVGDGNMMVHVSTASAVRLTCQRCLGPVEVPLETHSDLRVVPRDDMADELAGEDEPVVAPHWRLDVVRLVEDELLLALPAVPRHEDPPCRDELQHFGPEGETTPPEREKPFAALRALKRDEDQQD